MWNTVDLAKLTTGVLIITNPNTTKYFLNVFTYFMQSSESFQTNFHKCK